MLQNFNKGWDHYLSVLETEIIEEKLTYILESLTFKYTRQPQFLIIAPDRIFPSNLRISEKIKILNKEAEKDRSAKFFKALNEDLIDPKREEDVSNHVDSVLQIVNHSLLKKKVDEKLKQDGTSLSEKIQDIQDRPRKTQDETINDKIQDSKKKLRQHQENIEQERERKIDFSIHKDCALSGFDAIARRPKKHLIASLLWLINFKYRKTDRKTSCFIGNRSAITEATRAEVESEYDEILDILKESLLTNY